MVSAATGHGPSDGIGNVKLYFGVGGRVLVARLQVFGAGKLGREPDRCAMYVM
jgi:hypothetical protein